MRSGLRIDRAPRTFVGGPPTATRAILLMLLSTVALAGMVALARHLTTELPAIEVAFFRSFFGLAAFAPIFLGRGLEPLRTRRLGFHAVRGVIQATAMLAAYVGLATTPLAKFVAIEFSAPLFATAMAVLALGESIRLRRLAALMLGFSGMLVIVRPGFVALETGTLLVLAGAAVWGVALITLKVMGRTESAVTLTVYSTIFTSAFSLPPALWVWQTPTLGQLALLAAVGALGSLGLVCVAKAFQEADVSALLPIDFLKMVWATAFGFLLFGEIPDLYTWIGALLIFGSSTYIALRERRLRRA